MSVERLVYLDGQQAVSYKGLKHNPTLGRNFETMGPLEWLARMADHIPEPGKHRTLFYGYYANRVRGERAAQQPGVGEPEAEPVKKRRCIASWVHGTSTAASSSSLSASRRRPSTAATVRS